jgi:hypothetical protein
LLLSLLPSTATLGLKHQAGNIRSPHPPLIWSFGGVEAEAEEALAEAEDDDDEP